MKAYYAIDLSEDDGPMRARVYAAYDADQRIEQLTRALQSVTLVLVQMLDKHQALDRPGREALNEADSALSIPS